MNSDGATVTSEVENLYGDAVWKIGIIPRTLKRPRSSILGWDRYVRRADRSGAQPVAFFVASLTMFAAAYIAV